MKLYQTNMGTIVTKSLKNICDVFGDPMVAVCLDDNIRMFDIVNHPATDFVVVECNMIYDDFGTDVEETFNVIVPDGISDFDLKYLLAPYVCHPLTGSFEVHQIMNVDHIIL